MHEPRRRSEDRAGESSDPWFSQRNRCCAEQLIERYRRLVDCAPRRVVQMQIDANANDQRVQCVAIRHQLGQYAGQLATIDPNIVWPLELHHHTVLGQAFGQRDTARQRYRRQRFRTGDNRNRHRKQQRVTGCSVPDSLLSAAPASLKVSCAQQAPERLPYSRTRGQIFVGRSGDNYCFNSALAIPCERQRLRNVGRIECNRARLTRDRHRIQRGSQVLIRVLIRETFNQI
jgi:hypothetical protein